MLTKFFFYKFFYQSVEILAVLSRSSCPKHPIRETATVNKNGQKAVLEYY